MMNELITKELMTKELMTKELMTKECPEVFFFGSAGWGGGYYIGVYKAMQELWKDQILNKKFYHLLRICMHLLRICMPSATHLLALNTLQIHLRWKHCESPCSLASVVADLTGYQPRGRTRYIRLQ